jgi:cell division protein FtsL
MTETRNTSRRPTPFWKKINLPQAFKQAPWRSQIQLVGLFLLGLVVVLLVAGIYLTISGQAAEAGLDTYNLAYERRSLERSIADYKAQLAQISSSAVMEERAKSMGFSEANPDNVIYVSVPGYTGRQTAILAPPPGITQTQGAVVKTEYRDSLWDWLFQGINRLSSSVRGNS